MNNVLYLKKQNETKTSRNSRISNKTKVALSTCKTSTNIQTYQLNPLISDNLQHGNKQYEGKQKLLMMSQRIFPILLLQSMDDVKRQVNTVNCKSVAQQSTDLERRKQRPFSLDTQAAETLAAFQCYLRAAVCFSLLHAPN